MLLTQSLPPQFLLPSWNVRQLASAVQRAHISDIPSSDSHSEGPRQALVRKKYARKGLASLDSSYEGLKRSWQNEDSSTEKPRSLIRKHAVLPKTPRARWLAETQASVKDRTFSGRSHWESLGAAQVGHKEPTTTTERDSGGRNAKLNGDYSYATAPKLHNGSSPSSSPAEERHAKSADSITSAPMYGFKAMDHTPSAAFVNGTASGKSGPGNKRDKSRKAPSSKASMAKRQLSLFEELFPELQLQENAKQKAALDRLEQLPAFNWKREDILDPHLERGRANVFKPEPIDTTEMPSKYAPLQDQPAVLVLRGCSSSLEESDFFRQGPRGQHIEGWTNGIVKVIPSRDEKTLRFKGVYFVLFSRTASARAYLSQIIRLHTLSRIRGTDKNTFIPPPPGYLNEGEDLETVLKRYTLVPGYSKLRLSELNPPYGPAMQKTLKYGGPVAAASQKAKSAHLVLFTADVGLLSKYDVIGLLQRDGKWRNLHWSIAGGTTNVLQVDEFSFDADEERKAREKEKDLKQRFVPRRYVIPFTSEQEARRFVRGWHRKPFPPSQTSRGQETLPQIANAELIW